MVPLYECGLIVLRIENHYDSLHFITKPSEVPGTHLIDLGKKKS